MGFTILGPRYGPGESDVIGFFTYEERDSFLEDPVTDVRRSLQRRVFALFSSPEERLRIRDLIVSTKRAPDIQGLILRGTEADADINTIGEALVEKVRAILESSRETSGAQ